MTIQKFFSYALIVTIFAVTSAVMAAKDSPGTEDHPLVSRYTGSFIDGQQVLDFTSYTLPIGPVVKDKHSGRIPSKKVMLEGKVTRTLYRGPKERSTLEIQRNYRSALEAADFEVLYSCGTSQCGKLFHWIFYKEINCTCSKPLILYLKYI